MYENQTNERSDFTAMLDDCLRSSGCFKTNFGMFENRTCPEVRHLLSIYCTNALSEFQTGLVFGQLALVQIPDVRFLRSVFGHT